MLTPVFPLYAGSFGVSYGLIGLVLGGEALGMLLSDVPSGLLLRRLGLRRTALLGITCTGLATAACYWARSVPEVLVYQVVSGFGMSLYSVARHAYLTGMTAVGNRGRAISIFGGVFRIGSFAGPAVGGALAASFGLRLPFAVAGFGQLVALILVARYLRPPAARVAPAEARAPLGPGLLAAVRARYRVLASAGTAQLLAQTIRAGRRVVIPLYAADILGLDVTTIGIVVSLSAAIDMSLFYLAGLVMDRLGRKFAIVPSFLLQALGMALIPLSAGFVGLLGASLLIGLGNGLGSGTMMTLGSDLSPRQNRGEFLGMWRLIGDAGSSSGPLVVGGLTDLFVLQTAIWVVSATGLAAALVCLFLVPETLDRRSQVQQPG
jgi:MFS family permease